MSTSTVFFIFMGGVGLWIIIIFALGLFGKLFKREVVDVFTARKQEVERMVRGVRLTELSFLERFMQSFNNLTATKGDGEADLMTKIFQAGLPFFSPQHYYSRQIAYAVMMAAMGLLVGSAAAFLFRIPFIVVIVIAFLLGIWGSTLPAGEVRRKMNERVEGLILDMTYNITRLRMQFDRWGQIRPAIDRMLETAPKEGHFSDAEQSMIEKQWESFPEDVAVNLSMYLSGIGGNYFAELLNRFAMELSRGVSPEQAAERMKKHFKPSFEMDNFLKTLVAGINGEPIAERLREIDNRLHSQLSKRIRIAGAAAESIITLVSAITILPLFMIIGIPLALIALQFLGN